MLSRRRPALRAALLALIPFIALGMAGLGVWQLARLQERRAQNAVILQRLSQPPLELTSAAVTDVAQLDYRAVTVRGVFDFSQEIVWKGQAHEGASGVDVITPLRITGSEAAVLVNRGWLPYLQADAEARSAYQFPSAEVVIVGVMRRPDVRASPLLPADPPLGPERPRLDDWFWLDIAQIQRQMPYPLMPLVVEQTSGSPPGRLPISGYAPDVSEGNHFAYALQWFAFAAIAVVGPLVYWRRARAQRA